MHTFIIVEYSTSSRRRHRSACDSPTLSRNIISCRRITWLCPSTMHCVMRAMRAKHNFFHFYDILLHGYITYELAQIYVLHSTTIFNDGSGDASLFTHLKAWSPTLNCKTGVTNMENGNDVCMRLKFAIKELEICEYISNSLVKI